MYAFNKKYLGQSVRQGLSKKFNGKDIIWLETATQEELKHVYEVVGNHTHIVIELSPKSQKLTKEIKVASADVVRIDKLLTVKTKVFEKDGGDDKKLLDAKVKAEGELKKAKDLLIKAELALEELSE